MGGPVWIRQWPGSVRWFEAVQTSDLLQGPSKENPRGGKIRFERLRLRLCGKDWWSGGLVVPSSAVQIAFSFLVRGKELRKVPGLPSHRQA